METQADRKTGHARLPLALAALLAFPALADECPVEPNQCYFSNVSLTYDGETDISNDLPVGSVLGTVNLSLDFTCRLQEYLSGEAGRYIVLGITSEGSHMQGQSFSTNYEGLAYQVIPSGDMDGVGVKQVGGVANRIQLGIMGDRTLGPSECISGSLSPTFMELVKNSTLLEPGTFLINFRNPAFFVGARWNNTPPSYNIVPFPSLPLNFLPTTCELSEAPTRVDFGTFDKSALPLEKTFDFRWTCDGGTVVKTTLTPTAGRLIDGNTGIVHESNDLLLKIRDESSGQYVQFHQPVYHIIQPEQALGFNISFQAELSDHGDVKPGPFEFVLLYNTEYK
ncbi:hypothetical protein [Zestomonas carbonaria]|uniref:Pilin (Type 1 fimbria component protein) n=1 Tax=Zestomonas carbonaria TaxID=2762745 RepID=A0A7U7ESX5_9GAMM|nr:hypothetical protein [Pseudomonas carbonaria]CAD5110573.1 hypothetical protein PSEWESI4_04896 [Pseudomonas carbonaria]